MHIFHSWGKWNQYLINLPERSIGSRWVLGECIESRQRRFCQICGKAQDEYIVTYADLSAKVPIRQAQTP